MGCFLTCLGKCVLFQVLPTGGVIVWWSALRRTFPRLRPRGVIMTYSWKWVLIRYVRTKKVNLCQCIFDIQYTFVFEMLSPSAVSSKLHQHVSCIVYSNKNLMYVISLRICETQHMNAPSPLGLWFELQFQTPLYNFGHFSSTNCKLIQRKFSWKYFWISIMMSKFILCLTLCFLSFIQWK